MTTDRATSPRTDKEECKEVDSLWLLGSTIKELGVKEYVTN